MKVILLEYGYTDDKVEVEAFKSSGSLRNHLVNEVDFLSDDQVDILLESGSFERSWGYATIHKNYYVI